MLDRIDNWRTYLSDTDMGNDENLIKQHSRTGRPLGCDDFVRKLEAFTGKILLPKRPGRKAAIRK